MGEQKAPPGLGESGLTLWEDVTGRFDLDAENLGTLVDACRARDRLDVLATVLAESEPLVQTSQGVKPHPVFTEMRSTELAYARLVASLRLPEDDGEQPQRRGGARAPLLYPNAARRR